MISERQRLQHYLTTFQFKTLFREELGWDNTHEPPLSITIENQPYTLLPLAEKRTVKVYQCSPNVQGAIPDSRTMSKLEREVTQHAYEHLILYVDAQQQQQVWQWERREQGKPRALRRHRFQRGQSGEALALRLLELSISIKEDANLSTVDVAERTRRAFDIERVTKKFYDRFQKEHDAFLAVIQGIEELSDRSWYASLMLNRLMFVYFIQKKGLLDSRTAGRLDGDVHYLSSRLRQVQAQYGHDRFYSFYRSFLLRLFHEGLNQRERTSELEAFLGRIPYLNGGLFDLHQLERTYTDIQIPDEAFARLFAFLDEFEWHLDTRQRRNDREINPDVLGYIFEKYINQKQMGAYYTKEDITEYISKNTIIPYLFDAAERACQVAFVSDGPVWSLLRDNPDRYIYDAVKKGYELPLPAEIERGLHDMSQRREWNKVAPEPYALPTETWREVVARRTRYAEIKAKLVADEVTSINDLITSNLDICRFAEDVIAASEGVDLLRAFYDGIEHITVLDPTCGSGAFLFAALTILNPLYSACLDRMQDMVEERDQLDAALPAERRPARPSISRFREILGRVAQHPSRDYFILKSIIINNLYGVDIMEEATEICKLRLFLKLVAQIESYEQIEPLPDIDFNIRAGNTLVGFASYDEARQVITSQLDFDNTMERIEQRVKAVERGFADFRALQTRFQIDPKDMVTMKQQVREQLEQLNRELDTYLASQYGIDRHNIKQQAEYEKRFAAWKHHHQPFHWFAEFYGIMERGGFDVIIGNPPWKEYSSVKKTYTIRGYQVEACGNLHGICTERALRLRSSFGWMSYIVQLPLANSSRMGLARDLLRDTSNTIFVATFDDRPGKLFEGLQNCRSTIFISQSRQNRPLPGLATTRYQRWHSEVRQTLFSALEYVPIKGTILFADHFPKYGTSEEESLFRKVEASRVHTHQTVFSPKTTSHFIFYQEATRYWIKATVGIPYYAKNGGVSTPAHGRFLYFNSLEVAHAVCALLNSSLFYAYFIAYGDCFHLSDTLVANFPLTRTMLEDESLVWLNQKLMADLKDHAERKTIRTSDGSYITYDTFYGSKSKLIIDEIDHILARHYGFTDDELDFVINYDIKYRIGRDENEE